MSDEIHDFVVNLCDSILDDGAAQHLVNRLYKKRDIAPQNLKGTTGHPFKEGDHVFLKRDKDEQTLYVVEEAEHGIYYPYRIRHVRTGTLLPERYKADELVRVP